MPSVRAASSSVCQWVATSASVLGGWGVMCQTRSAQRPCSLESDNVASVAWQTRSRQENDKSFHVEQLQFLCRHPELGEEHVELIEARVVDDQLALALLRGLDLDPHP